MFSLQPRQQTLLVAVLLGAVAFAAARYWQDAQREAQAVPIHDPR